MKHKSEISAGGVVYKTVNGETTWLITQHSQHKGWGFPKGLIADIDKNESMQDAALREVREEGGVTAQIMDTDPVETTYRYKFEDMLVDKKVYFYLMKYVSGDPANHDWEVSEAKFATEKDVFSTLTFSADREAFTKILKLVV